MCPPIVQNYRRGSALLAVVLVLAVVSSILSIGTAKITQAAINSTGSNKATMQAQQYAASEADLIKSINYADLTAQSRADISDSGFQREVILSDESDYSEQIKQKTATINVYKGNESLPRSTIKLIRYSAEQKTGGVPIGTVIAWASSKNPSDGTWLECNGQSCAAYSELSVVLGKTTVPDYRGVFLRGLGTRETTHFGNVLHSSGNLGEIQGDAMMQLPKSSFHAALGRIGSDFASEQQQSTFSCTGAFSYSSVYNTAMKTGNSDNWGREYVLDFSRAIPVSNELRPVNIAVRYFIKAA